MRISIILVAAVATITFSDAFNINLGLSGGLNLGGLGGALHALIPDLRLGTRVDLLIDLATVLEILSRPFDAEHALTNCDSGSLPVSLGRNGLSSSDSRWYKDDDGTWFVPVVMDPNFTSDETNTIYAGLINIQDKTCMRFYIYNEADLAGFDYVYVVRGSGKGCYSNYIGRAHVGKQIINLQPMEPSGCIIAGIAAHEFLHAIGFDHQQNTPGRNNYVTINYQNIQSGKSHNFNEDSASEYSSFGEAYDYGSVMHYGEYAFTSNGQKTIVVKQATSAKVGQRDGLTDIDARKLNKMHGCPA